MYVIMQTRIIILVVYHLVSNIIFISGKAESGKDTVAEMMHEYMTSIGERSFIFRFGDILKYILKTYYNWNGIKDFYGRNMLQSKADEIKSINGNDFFANFISSVINANKEMYDNSSIIISDWRYINELNYIEKNVEHKSIITVRIVRQHDNMLDGKQKEHSSENELDNFDFTFYINSNTIEGKRIQQKDIVDKILADGG